MAIQLLLVPLRAVGMARLASKMRGDPKTTGNIQLGVKTNSKQIQKKLSSFQKVLPRIIDKGVKQAGFQLLEIIKTKTKKGIDIRGRKFERYSSGYLRRLNREQRPTKVDLHYDGDMLRSLTPNSTVKKTGRHKISLAFSNAEQREKALFNQVFNDPKRVFFGFNKKTEKIINRSFNRFVQKELRKFKI